MCERISPISPEKCPPYIDNCEQTIKDIAYTKAHELYGENLPEIVANRLQKELDSIIKTLCKFNLKVEQTIIED